ncbi:MAG: imidazolonepropionase [Deltaproteobacteria bacterium]|nr:imidazolonepropionase [Deltaproteobacteria bacterium]
MLGNNEKPKADILLTGASEIVVGEPKGSAPLGRVAGGVVALGDGIILAIGSLEEVRREVNLDSAEKMDVAGGLVAPGFVDCHTHLIFGGSRAKEYALRLTKSVAEVKAMGMLTGIPATVAATRAAGLEELWHEAGKRVTRMFAAGSTTIESKSGYGLSVADELKMLEVNRRLALDGPAEIVSTFLGAHDFPPDMDRQRYMDVLIKELIPRVAGEKLALFCDVYCDDGYYTPEETKKILRAGLDHGLQPKIHADAYAARGGAALAAEVGAVSAAHLNYATPGQMKKLAEAGVVGVIMPALDFSVKHPRPFDARAMIEQGMTLALATDLCPGCYVESLSFVIRLACRLYGLSLEQAFSAATIGAAKALDREADLGSLARGKKADIQVWDVNCLEELPYRLDFNPVVMVLKEGRVVVDLRVNKNS